MAKAKKAASKQAVKKSAAKKATTAKVVKAAAKPADYKAVIAGLAKGTAPKSVGLLIRARILEAKKDHDDILAEVKKRFKESTASVKDIYWNRGKLKRDGVKVPAPFVAE